MTRRQKIIVIILAVAVCIGVYLMRQPSPQQPQTVSISHPTNAIPVVLRESLTDTMTIHLESPPGGLALQPDGKIVVGTTLFGKFINEKTGSLSAFTRGAFRLNPNGSLDRTFLCDVNIPGSAAQMSHLVAIPDGRLFISGLFGTVAGKPRPNYAVLLPDGSLDESFVPWRGAANQPPAFFLPKVTDPTVWGLTAYQGGAVPATWLPDNSVAILCNSIESTNPAYALLTSYRLDATGRWIRPANNVLAGEFLRPSGLVLTLGPVGFWARKPINWTRNQPLSPVNDLPFDQRIIEPSALDAARVLRALFEEVPIELCRYAVKLPDGGAILAIRDKGDSGITAPGRFMRFDKNWKPDLAFTNQFEADIRGCLSIKQQPDGKLLVAGLIGKLNGEDFPGLVRLDATGQIDRSFHCETANTSDGRVMDLAVQADGRIVICGFFNTVNGVDVPHIARLNPDGSLDQSFCPPFKTTKTFNEDFRKVHK